MSIKRDGRLALFLIDGSNLHASVRQLGYSVDYKKLLDMYEGTVHKAYYFTALPPVTEDSTLRPMIDFIEFNGYTVIQKEWKEFQQTQRFTCTSCNEPNELHSQKTKGNMDIEIAVIALENAPFITELFIFTGDGDFRFLIEAMQRQYGIHVTVVSTIKTRPMMCADALRRQADAFIDLADLQPVIGRNDEEKGERRNRFTTRRTNV